MRLFVATMSMNGRKILLVDDDLVVLVALSGKLRARGYETIIARDGSQAVNVVRTKKPDLILLDLTFPTEVGGPGWDGFRIIDWLKRIDEAANIPIVIISGGDRDKYEARAIAAGASAFFSKPVESEELFALIEQTLAGATPKA